MYEERATVAFVRSRRRGLEEGKNTQNNFTI
jgi:hypothetical protein